LRVRRGGRIKKGEFYYVDLLPGEIWNIDPKKLVSCRIFFPIHYDSAIRQQAEVQRIL